MRKSKTKIDLSKKQDAAYNVLVKGCQKELTKFEMRKLSYTLNWLCKNIPSEKIPYLHKLNKKYPGSKIVNVGGIAILHIKKDYERGE